MDTSWQWNPGGMACANPECDFMTQSFDDFVYVVSQNDYFCRDCASQRPSADVVDVCRSDD